MKNVGQIRQHTMGETSETPISFSTLSSLDEHPETARLLGNLTVAWSHAERVLYLMFWVASGTTQQKAFDIYESISSFRSRYELTLRLLAQNGDEHPKIPEILSYLETLLHCLQQRNELTHRTWTRSQDGKLALLDHRLRRKEAALRRIDDKDIRTLIITINSTCDKIISALPTIYPAAFGKS